jgi:hypothetical protein
MRKSLLECVMLIGVGLLVSCQGVPPGVKPPESGEQPPKIEEPKQPEQPPSVKGRAAQRVSRDNRADRGALGHSPRSLPNESYRSAAGHGRV